MKHTLYKTKFLQGALFVSALFVGAAMFFGTSGTALAATKTWTGTSGDGLFSTGGNWSDGLAPAAGDNLKFDLSSTLIGSSINNDMTSLSIGSISFGGTPQTGSTTGFTILGNAITVTSATPVSMNVPAAVRSRVVAPLIFTTNSTITGTSTGTCSSASVGLQLDDVSVGTKTVTTSGCVKLVSLTGSGDVTGGTGTLGLSSLAGISGHIIAKGHVQISGTQGAAAGFSVQNGGSLNFVPLSTTAITITKPLTLSGSGGVDKDGAQWDTVDFGATGAPVMAYTYSGPVTLLTNANVGTPGNVDTVDFSGTFVANGHLLGYANGAGVTASGSASPYVQQGTYAINGGTTTTDGDSKSGGTTTTKKKAVATSDGKVPGAPDTGERGKNNIVAYVTGVTVAAAAGLVTTKKTKFFKSLISKR